MNLRVPVRCSKKVEENGGFSLTLGLLPDMDGKDKLVFTGAKEMAFITHSRETAREVNIGDTLYLSLFTSDQ